MVRLREIFKKALLLSNTERKLLQTIYLFWEEF